MSHLRLQYNVRRISEQSFVCFTRVTTLCANCMEWPYHCNCFVVQLMESYVDVNIRPLKIFKRPLTTLWQTFVVDHHFVQSQSAFFLETGEFRPKGNVAHFVDLIQLWAVAVCNFPSRTKVGIIPTNIRSVIFWKYCSVLRFSKRNVENYWSVTWCHLKSAMLCSWEQQS